MYEITREKGRVVIWANQQNSESKPIYNVSDDAYIVFVEKGSQRVCKVKDLPDEQLLLALASAVPLKI